MEKIKIPYPIIVEGKYDKIKLSSILDANIFTTDGFGIFKNTEKSMLFRSMTEKSPIIVLTDSDGGGTVIRSKLLSFIPKDKVINLYVPEIKGKEKRKTEPSKSGTLGVEGIDSAILRSLFMPFSSDKTPKQFGEIKKADLYALGLLGSENSASLRASFSVWLGLPANITPNSLISALNILYDKEEFLALFDKFSSI